MKKLPSGGPQISCDWSTGDCDPDRHPNWEHATSFEQIEKTLDVYGKTYDQDGDQVDGITIYGAEQAGQASIHYKSSGTGAYIVSTNDDGESRVGYVLVPIQHVTDEEIAAAIRSITGGS